MADEPQTNGPADGGKYIDSIDPEDPEYIRQMRRPAEIKEDVRQMEQRKRVSLILRSEAFREELEQIIHEQIKQGPHPASLIALQQISELIAPKSGYGGQTTMAGRASGTVLPIADIRGVDSLNYGKGEKILRCKVASAYRLVDIYGWAQGLNAQITARISQEHEHFLTSPYGLLCHEVTAASLLKVDMQGEVVDTGSTRLTVNKNNFALHAAIHAARPDLKSIIHLKHPSALSVSVMKCGLLPLCQEALLLGEISYYDYQGSIPDQEESDRLTRELGPSNRVLFLRNHGIVVCGESIEHAFSLAHSAMAACETQIRTIPVGLDNIVLPSDEARQRIVELASQDMYREDDGDRKVKWRRGELEFEGHMRHLDNAGYRTGYNYHEPLQRRDPKKERSNADVEIPPASSNFSYFFDDDKEYRSPLKQHLERQKKQHKSDWLNTPNAYKKEEFEETGTPNPKKITKWVSEGSSTTPIKVENPNQFAPQGTDPKELSQKHKSIRSDYYTEKKTAGPQSKILEGMTWEEAQRLKDGQMSGTQDSVIVVGAASKGIIQRDHQHNAVVYKQYYAPNPFDSMNEDEIEKYKEEVERKAHGGDGPDVVTTTTTTTTIKETVQPGPDGRLISTEERMTQVRTGTQAAGDQDNLRPGVQETSIDDTFDSPQTTSTPAKQEPPSPTRPGQFNRTTSARYPERNSELVDELQQNFERSKSERKPKRRVVSATETNINGEEAHPAAGSPTKSTSSGEGTLDERSSREGSPTKERPPELDSPSKGDKKKKKKFRIPSFSKKKDKK